MRILLFLATNLAIMVLVSLIFTVFGIGGILADNGIDLNLPGLLIFCGLYGMGLSLFSLLFSKGAAKRGTGTQIIETARNQDEKWLLDTVQSLAANVGIGMPEVGVFPSDAANAFATGWNRNNALVAVSTGLLRRFDKDEVRAVLAHEIGHYRLGHIPKRLLLSFIMGTLVFWLISTCLQSKWIYEGLGLEVTLVGSLSSLLVGLSMTLGALGYWFSPLSNQLSRKHEYEADEFAKNAVGTSASLVSALRKLHVENLSFPFPHSLISTFHHSHPTLMERERALLK